MTRAADRLRLLQVRDSILRETTKRDTDRLSVVIDASFSEAIARQLDSLIRDRWARAAAGRSARTVIAAVLDSSTVVGGAVRPRTIGSTSITAFLPDSSAHTPCVSILRIPMPISARTPTSFRRDLIAPETIGALLGPCLYYAAFGTPGTSVARWLREGGWRLAHVTDWHALPPTFAPPPRLVYTRLPSSNAVIPSFAYQPRLWTSTSGLACLAGEPGRCMSALVPRGRDDADTLWRRRIVSTTGADERAFRMPRARSALGPSEGWLLSEMVRTLGKERFAAFWRSNEPLADAFRAATNQSLDAWVHDWAVRMYGPLPIGPGLNQSAAFTGAGFLIVAMILAAAVARVRRVT
jgi:hypothetical protein